MKIKELKKGYTTGSCCAAGVSAALRILLLNKKIDNYQISGPTGLDILVPINSVKKINNTTGEAVVIKDGGDDPDVTTGAHVISKCKLVKSWGESKREKMEKDTGYFLNEKVYLKGGQGIGIVTKPGLACREGKCAINPVPREMILKEVLEVLEEEDYGGCVEVFVDILEGKELALKTFNPKLGIVGGISILGTSGQVNPMSSQAILDTIKVELSVAMAMAEREGHGKSIVLTPGNYGYDFFRNYSQDKIVKVSNFFGAGVNMAAEMGFEKILISSHLGKIIKVAGGMMDTHSKNGDNRVATAMKFVHLMKVDFKGFSKEKALEKIKECTMVDEIIKVIKEASGENGVDEFSRIVAENAMSNLRENLEKTSGKYDKIDIDLVIFTNKYGLLFKGDLVEI